LNYVEESSHVVPPFQCYCIAILGLLNHRQQMSFDMGRDFLVRLQQIMLAGEMRDFTHEQFTGFVDNVMQAVKDRPTEAEEISKIVNTAWFPESHAHEPSTPHEHYQPRESMQPQAMINLNPLLHRMQELVQAKKTTPRGLRYPLRNVLLEAEYALPQHPMHQLPVEPTSVKATTDLFKSCIVAALKLREPQTAGRVTILLTAMRLMDVPRTTEIYNLLMECIITSDLPFKFGRAEQLFVEMRRDVKPDVRTYRCIIRAALHAVREEEVAALDRIVDALSALRRETKPTPANYLDFLLVVQHLIPHRQNEKRKKVIETTFQLCLEDEVFDKEFQRDFKKIVSTAEWDRLCRNHGDPEVTQPKQEAPATQSDDLGMNSGVPGAPIPT